MRLEGAVGLLADRVADGLSAPTERVWIQYGRSLIAVATGLTLWATPRDVLFALDRCEGAGGIGLFCLIGQGAGGLSFATLVLLLVVSGLFPLVSSILHWWVSYSVFQGISIFEGGDQIAAIVCLIIIPYYFTAPFLNGYKRMTSPRPATGRYMLGQMCLLLVSVQLAYLYLESALQKMRVDEWANGTAMWYLLNEPRFGWGLFAAEHLQWVFSGALVISVATWTPIVIEVVMGVFQARSQGFRIACLAIGTVFHVAIAAVLAITSFSIIMIGCLMISAARGSEGRRLTGPGWQSSQ